MNLPLSKNPSPASAQAPRPGMVLSPYVTTAFDLPGFRTTRSLGVVRGIVVRSRSVVGNFLAGLQTIMGGNITIYSSLCEKARIDAYEGMIHQAARLGANAIIGMRYESNEVMAGVTEVLCYGTAVVVEKVADGSGVAPAMGQAPFSQTPPMSVVAPASQSIQLSKAETTAQPQPQSQTPPEASPTQPEESTRTARPAPLSSPAPTGTPPPLPVRKSD